MAVAVGTDLASVETFTGLVAICSTRARSLTASSQSTVGMVEVMNSRLEYSTRPMPDGRVLVRTVEPSAVATVGDRSCFA